MIFVSVVRLLAKGQGLCGEEIGRITFFVFDLHGVFGKPVDEFAFAD